MIESNSKYRTFSTINYSLCVDNSKSFLVVGSNLGYLNFFLLKDHIDDNGSQHWLENSASLDKKICEIDVAKLMNCNSRFSIYCLESFKTSPQFISSWKNTLLLWNFENLHSPPKVFPAADDSVSRDELIISLAVHEDRLVFAGTNKGRIHYWRINCSHNNQIEFVASWPILFNQIATSRCPIMDLSVSSSASDGNLLIAAAAGTHQSAVTIWDLRNDLPSSSSAASFSSNTVKRFCPESWKTAANGSVVVNGCGDGVSRGASLAQIDDSSEWLLLANEQQDSVCIYHLRSGKEISLLLNNGGVRGPITACFAGTAHNEVLLVSGDSTTADDVATQRKSSIISKYDLDGSLKSTMTTTGKVLSMCTGDWGTALAGFGPVVEILSPIGYHLANLIV